MVVKNFHFQEYIEFVGNLGGNGLQLQQFSNHRIAQEGFVHQQGPKWRAMVPQPVFMLFNESLDGCLFKYAGIGKLPAQQ